MFKGMILFTNVNNGIIYHNKHESVQKRLIIMNRYYLYLFYLSKYFLKVLLMFVTLKGTLNI